MNILLTDTNPSRRSQLKYLLQEAGYRVVVAKTVQEFKQFLAKQRMAVVILDSRIPGIEEDDDLQPLIHNMADSAIILQPEDDEGNGHARLPEMNAAEAITQKSRSTELLARVQALTNGENSPSGVKQDGIQSLTFAAAAGQAPHPGVHGQRQPFIEARPSLASSLAGAFSQVGPLASVDVARIILVLCAALLWLASLGNIPLNQMGGLGLISVLPLSFYLAFDLLLISFCLSLWKKQLSVAALLPQVILLIFMLYGTTVFVQEVPTGHVNWRHAGYTEYLMRGGELDGQFEFYFNFPGFFALGALATTAAGYQNPVSYMAWAPVFFNLLYLLPLVLIFRSVTADQRLVGVGLWFFYLTNWVRQDFFLPQAFAYFFYLACLAILLRWFFTSTAEWEAVIEKVERWSRFPKPLLRLMERLAPPTRPDEPVKVWQRVALLAVLVPLLVLMVSSHPLTPFFFLSAVTGLVLFNRITPRGLPVLAAVLIGAWISYMAIAYMRSTHAAGVISEVGDVGSAISANITNRVRGNDDHLFVVRMRILTSALLGGMALFGVLHSLRKGRLYLSLLILAVTPFMPVLLTGYGGEMLLRIYLVALPAVAFFAAALFYPEPATNTAPWKIVLLGLLSFLLMLGFLFSRYGDERVDKFTVAEVEGLRYVYSVAEPGSLMVSVSPFLPWKFQDYEQYRYWVKSNVVRNSRIDEIIEAMEDQRFPQAYLILTSSQRLFMETNYGWPPDTWDRFEQALAESGKFKTIFANEDAQIIVLDDWPDRCASEICDE